MDEMKFDLHPVPIIVHLLNHTFTVVLEFYNMNIYSSKTFFSSNENIFLIPTKTELNFILDQIIFDLKINDSELNFLRYLLQNLKPKNIEDRNFIIAPNNDYLIRKMKCSVSTIQRRIRKLVEAGLIFYKKSPIGRRFFKSKNNNQYGFDLSPLFYRYQEFLELAKKQKEELHKEYLDKKKNVEVFFENHKTSFLPKEKIEQLDIQESETLFDQPDKKITEDQQLFCEKSYPQKVKNDHLTNNIKFKKEIKNKEKIITLFQKVGLQTIYDQSCLFEIMDIKSFHSWVDLLASTRSLLMALHVPKFKLDSLLEQYNAFEAFLIAYLAAVKYERLEIEEPSKFINPFFYENHFDFLNEVENMFSFKRI